MITAPLTRYECVELDASNNCTAWSEAQTTPVMPALPTLDQAVSLGGQMLTGLLIIAAMFAFLSPPSDKDNDP